MAKTKPIGVRFDEDKLAMIMTEQNLTSAQQVVTWLMDRYSITAIGNKITENISTQSAKPVKYVKPALKDIENIISSDPRPKKEDFKVFMDYSIALLQWKKRN